MAANLENSSGHRNGKGQFSFQSLRRAIPKNSKENKKAFLGDEYKEIEKNNRMGKNRDLLKDIRDTK